MLAAVKTQTCLVSMEASKLIQSGADPGFLESGFICINVLGILSNFYLILLKYPMNMK